MWSDKYGIHPDDDSDEPIEPEEVKAQEPRHGDIWTDEPQVFEVAVYLQVFMEDGSAVPARLKVRADDYNVGAFTEVLQLNRLPYSVRPAEPDPEEDDHEEG